MQRDCALSSKAYHSQQSTTSLLWKCAAVFVSNCLSYRRLSKTLTCTSNASVWCTFGHWNSARLSLAISHQIGYQPTIAKWHQQQVGTRPLCLSVSLLLLPFTPLYPFYCIYILSLGTRLRFKTARAKNLSQTKKIPSLKNRIRSLERFLSRGVSTGSQRLEAKKNN